MQERRGVERQEEQEGNLWDYLVGAPARALRMLVSARPGGKPERLAPRAEWLLDYDPQPLGDETFDGGFGDYFGEPAITMDEAIKRLKDDDS